MKNIIFYIRKKTDPLVGRVTEAAIEGLRYLGVDFEIKYETEYEPSEIAILFGYYKNVNVAGRRRKKVYDGQEVIGKRVMVLERGFVRREDYHSAGWNGICGRADFKNTNMPDDRWKQLNIEIKPWKTEGKTVLLCGQVAWDSAVQSINDGTHRGIDGVSGYLEWLKKTAEDLQKYVNGREIVFVPHPLFRRHDFYKEFLPVDIRWSDKTLAEELNDAFACCAFNSNSTIDAAIEGVHPYVFDKGAMLFEVGNKTVKRINKPKLFDREQFFNNLGYAQWSENEISFGLPYLHLIGNK